MKPILRKVKQWSTMWSQSPKDSCKQIQCLALGTLVFQRNYVSNYFCVEKHRSYLLQIIWNSPSDIGDSEITRSRNELVPLWGPGAHLYSKIRGTNVLSPAVPVSCHSCISKHSGDPLWLLMLTLVSCHLESFFQMLINTRHYLNTKVES